MKALLTLLIRRRNPVFTFDPALSNAMLLAFVRVQALCMIRGWKLLLLRKRPQGAMLEPGVTFRYAGRISFGRFLKIGRGAHLSALGTEGIALGNHVSIGAYSRVVVSTTLNALGTGIRLGNRVGIGEFAYLGGAGGLDIGDDCIVGQYFSCHPENHVFSEPDQAIRLQGTTRRGIRIGANCWIGSKVTVLDGVTIGEGCVIAAGSVVNKEIPAFSVAAGVPARVISRRNQPETAPTAPLA